MTDKSQKDTLATLKDALKNSAFTNKMGAVPTYCQDGESIVEMEVAPDMTQHMGIIHGAVLGFIADSACCWAAISELGNVVTSEYKINFIKPAIGKKLIAKGKVIGSTHKSATTRADIFVQKNGSEKLVATALATIASV
jgi:uncharacterized protein (TIGR00369 family)